MLCKERENRQKAWKQLLPTGSKAKTKKVLIHTATKRKHHLSKLKALEKNYKLKNVHLDIRSVICEKHKNENFLDDEDEIIKRSGTSILPNC